MWTKIKKFWADSYHSDRLAFYLEMQNFFFSVGASMMLASTANHPNMAFIYPFYFVGSTSQVVASYRRGQPWIMLVTMWFATMNVIGWTRAMGWL
jgi:hypothetical protein